MGRKKIAYLDSESPHLVGMLLCVLPIKWGSDSPKSKSKTGEFPSLNCGGRMDGMGDAALQEAHGRFAGRAAAVGGEVDCG